LHSLRPSPSDLLADAQHRLLVRGQGRAQGLIPPSMFRNVLLLALLAAPAVAEEPGVSLSGSGLITLPSTATLAAGHGTVGIAADVKDRDPLSLDVAEYPAFFGLGLGQRFEMYGHLVVSSVVAVPEAPVLPPPPLDLILPMGAPVPAYPLYTLYSPAPYVNKRSPDRFERFVPGDAVIGGKLRLCETHGWAPAVAVGAEIAFPVTRSLHKLQQSAGTGTFDLAGRLIGEWALGRTALVADAGFVRVGPPQYGDRIIAANNQSATAIDQALQLPARVELGAGLRQPLSHKLAAVAEFSTVYEVGSHTATVYRAQPRDLIAGLQFRSRHAWISAAARYQAHIPPKDTYPSPIAGYVDLTDVPAPQLAQYLRDIGVGGATPKLRADTQRVAVPSASVPLPAGARVIPSTYKIRANNLDSLHGLDFIISFGGAF
jgi:hypothetical protein